MKNLLQTAQFWTMRNIAVVPIRYRDKRPLGNLLPDGKWENYKTVLPSDTEYQRWFSSRLRNIGVVVGWNNLVVIDFDRQAVYNKWLLWAARKGGWAGIVASQTYQVRTSRGVHVYVFTRERELNRKLEGIDIKAQSGYVLAPPSVHPSGAKYEAFDDNAEILSIDTLSEILPMDLLTSSAAVTEYQNPGIAALVATKRVLQQDPWESAVTVPDPTRDLIVQIRERTSLLSWFPDVEQSSRDGRWWRARCPFHDDKVPSFWIDVQRGICGCFSGCTSKPLDVINLYARLHGISEREAIFVMMRG